MLSLRMLKFYFAHLILSHKCTSERKDDHMVGNWPAIRTVYRLLSTATTKHTVNDAVWSLNVFFSLLRSIVSSV